MVEYFDESYFKDYSKKVVSAERYEALEAKLAALVDISSRAYSLLCELGSPHCNTELAIKDIAMISEEIRDALAQVKGTP